MFLINILRSLLHNRGFTSGLLVGLGYFAAVNGFAYVIALYFQFGLGFNPAGAALALTFAAVIGMLATVSRWVQRLRRGRSPRRCLSSGSAWARASPGSMTSPSPRAPGGGW
jgi:hypothetical protein